MKKVLTILFLIFISLNVYTQSLSGIKICVNPGHGGHDSDDRFIPATGFWESDGNLAKGLHLRDILEGYGATIIMTRTQNRTQDDLPLSQIVAISNQNNVDYMHAIHSNAHNAQVNYTLILFQGFDNQPTYPLALTMGLYLGDEIQKANRTTTKYNRGDFDFYGTGQPYLGVFRNLNMPGTLSEGSFHDYVPESWRLKNNFYDRHEAIGISRAFLRLYSGGPDPTGAIAGIIRDPNRNVNYYYIPSTGDQKQPVNNLTVTLEPGNEVYFGDDQNNGFYLFDSLAPGSYTLYFEAENFSRDSVNIEVLQNTSVFADKFLNEAPNYDAPVVLSNFPDSSAENTSLTPTISVEFDIRMDTASVRNALNINPAAVGNISWENNSKKLNFTPTVSLQPGTEYIITIDTTAKTLWQTNLVNEFSFSFTTRSKLNLISVYPSDGLDDVSLSAVFIIQFDAPIQPQSLSGNVTFVDSTGSSVQIKVPSGYGEGFIIFETQSPLIPNAEYTLTLGEGITDSENLTFGEHVEINFTTEAMDYGGGNIIDNFESAGSWWDPEQSGSTSGTDPAATTFGISTERKYNGSNSGKLTYVFTGDNGLCRVFNPIKPNVGSNNSSEVGVWVFGDLSYNILEYWFYYNSSTNAIVEVDTLNWTGWKLKKIKIADIAGSGDRLFHSFVVRQTPNGVKSSQLYFDDFQSDIVTGVEDENNNINPVDFVLYQNYPNPFNPSTVINFSLPEKSFVTLKVYNILGKEVASLVNENMEPGSHSVKFNTQSFGLPSGVYIYKITAGNFSESKKMLLLK